MRGSGVCLCLVIWVGVWSKEACVADTCVNNIMNIYDACNSIIMIL